MKVPICLRIEGKERRETLTIWHPCVILEFVDIGVGEAGMNINDWRDGERPRKMNHAPADHAVGHV